MTRSDHVANGPWSSSIFIYGFALIRMRVITLASCGFFHLAALQPDDFLELDSTGSSKKMDSLMRTPREYAKRVYLSLAIHAGK